MRLHKNNNIILILYSEFNLIIDLRHKHFYINLYKIFFVAVFHLSGFKYLEWESLSS